MGLAVGERGEMMERKDFYTVNECEWFIPVKLIEIEEDKYTKTLEVEAIESGYRAFVPRIYKFKKVEEPQKPVVPKFVGEWIEDHKGDYSKWDEESRADFVFRSINDLFRFEEGLSPWDFTIYEEFSKWTTENAYEFITAILFDYTVKKEKLYTVEIPNNGGTLVLACINQTIKLVDGNKHFPGKFTKGSIENAGFDWALKWAKPVEEN